MSIAMHNVEPEVSETLRAPFPWFGGKRRVAELVWSRLGNVDTYNEPFFGSGAVLLARPHAPRVETINDIDSFVANFWRAVQADPEAVAYYADGPVNEADLHARHRWLVERGRRRVLRCSRDPHYFDPKIAGWWVWGQCLWIGSGWCQSPEWRGRTNAGRRARGLLTEQYGRAGYGVEQKRRPHLTGDQGVIITDAQRTAATRSGEQPWNQKWQGGGAGGGSGVHAPTLTQQKPNLRGDSGATGSGVVALARSEGLYDYILRLTARLRRVRVCNGDWTRVTTPSVTTYIGMTGMFLDPPYQHDLRERCYSEDHDISAEVREWAITHGDDPNIRIALCGYEGEHVIPDSWECVPWKAHGGYSRSERGVANRSRERIWFSPHCLQPTLFSSHRKEAAS